MGFRTGLGLLVITSLAIGCAHASPTPTAEDAAPRPAGEPAPAPPIVDTSPHELVPQDWILAHRGKHGPTEVLSREELHERRNQHLHTSGSLEKKPPLLFDQTAIRLTVGQVLTFSIEDVVVKRIIVDGGAAEGFRTKPYLIHRHEEDGSTAEHRAEDLHLLGAVVGAGHVEVETDDGESRRFEIDVVPAGNRSS